MKKILVRIGLKKMLNSYANNKVKRIDLDVLARICIALNVEVGDLIKLQRNKGEF